MSLSASASPFSVLIRHSFVWAVMLIWSASPARSEPLVQPVIGHAAPLTLEVAELTQRGDIANCGPTAAAMVLAHAGFGADPRQLRDRIGRWSWRHFPLRAFSIPGRSSGMTTPHMMREVLQAFGGQGRFRALRHPFVPGEA